MTKTQYCKILFDSLSNFDGVFFKVYSNKLQKYIYLSLQDTDNPNYPLILTCHEDNTNFADELTNGCKFSLANLKKICTSFDINVPIIGKSQNEMDLIESEYLIWKKINNYLPYSSFAK